MNHGESQLEIDLYTPMLDKDIRVFLELRKSITRFLKHPIGNHFVVGPDSVALRKMCESEGCIFVEESSLLGITPDDLKPYLTGLSSDRSGWLFQQLLKLSCDKVSDKSAILVLDADTVFVSNVRFEKNGRFLLEYTDGYMECYDHATHKLLNDRATIAYSFVCHHMLMHREHLVSLRESLEKDAGCSWIDRILNAMPPNSFQPFSEYELFANYVLKFFRRSYFLEYWFNTTENLRRDFSLDSVVAKYGHSHRTVSLHYYQRAEDC